jgi:hypothetical protein
VQSADQERAVVDAAGVPLRHGDAANAAGRIFEVKAHTYFFDAGQPAARARVARVGTGKAAGGQDADAGRRQPRHQPCRAPNAPRRPHPALRYTAIVGRESVIARMDCGLGGRVHADLV